MRILYHQPSSSIYAGRTIYHGYQNAFRDLGHEFKTLTANDDLQRVVDEFDPQIFITALNSYYLRFLDLEVIKRQRKKGLKVFVNTPFWNSPLSRLRVNECQSLSKNKEQVNLIKSGNFGDYYFNTVEQGDMRMEDFQIVTGHPYYTVPLAADKIILRHNFDERFKSDISYIGTYLPEKRHFFDEYVLPLREMYALRIYGQDWTRIDRALGFAQKVGQYFNIPRLSALVKPKLELMDEARIYSSSKICINVHEQYQKDFGGDCNERTFKIPLSGGFEITDDVQAIRKYFSEDEMVIAKDKRDWFEKIDFYMRHPEERTKIANRAKKRVISDHTYHNRVTQIINTYLGIT